MIAILKRSRPGHLVAFVLSNIKRIMNSFIREIDGLYNINYYFPDVDSLYIEREMGCVG